LAESAPISGSPGQRRLPGPRSRHTSYWPIALILAIALLLLTARNTEFDIPQLFAGMPRFWAIFSSLAQPDFAIMPEVLNRAAETLQISLLSVAIGAVLAFPISFLAARNLMHGNFLAAALYYVCRTLINLIRSIPDLFWALVFVASVGLGPFPGVLALTMFAVGMLGKLYSEAIEGIDPGPVEAITATGATRSQVVAFAVLPQIVPYFVAHTLYAWEINVRVATVVGMVGAGGLGFLLRTYMGYFQYRQAATVILVTMLMVMAIDIGSARIRERII
jgi:phosphonate transport system permease protein